MTRINIFGCSFSQGLPREYRSWVDDFVDMVPEYDVYNYAIGGTSILFHLYLLHEAKKGPDDITVFQFTSSGRQTWWQPFDFRKLMRRHPDKHNYVRLDNRGNMAVAANTKRINLGISNKRSHPNYKLSMTYYEHASPEMLDFEHATYINATKNLIDYGFFHRHNYWHGLYPTLVDNYDSVQDDLGNEEFKRLSIDEGHHFGPEGHRIEAQWVYDNLKERKLI